MTSSTMVAANDPAVRTRRRLAPGAAFYLLASLTVSFLAGSSAPTPLYPLYQAEWGFSPTAITLVFGIYAVALLFALLVTGRVSDHIGRRPVLMAAAAIQAVTMAVFATADGLSTLLIARVIQGLSTGAALAAIGAGMLDLDKVRGGIANSVAPPLGTATGGLVAALMVHFLPAPTQLVYVVFAVVFVMQGIGVACMAESITPRAGALASLKPQFSVPPATRQPLLVAMPVLVAAWALAGFYASLGPALVGRVFGLDASLLGGIALFVVAGCGAAAVFLLQAQQPCRMLVWGALALLAGVGVTIAAISTHSAPVFFVGTAIAGAGFGSGFQGAIRSVVTFAQPHERAGVLSVLFVVSYLAMSVPAVLAGFLVSHHVDITAVAQDFGGVVMLLAAVALVGTLVRRRQRQ